MNSTEIRLKNELDRLLYLDGKLSGLQMLIGIIDVQADLVINNLIDKIEAQREETDNKIDQLKAKINMEKCIK